MSTGKCFLPGRFAISRRQLIAGSAGGLSAMLTSPLAKAIDKLSLPAYSRWPSTAAVDRVLNDAIHARRLVGASILIAQDGELVYQRTAGFADREASRAVQAEDSFRIASMTKLVVSVTVLSLIESGLLRLDDPVSRWLPDFRPKTKEGRQDVITIRHLLTHTAGLSYGFLSGPDGGDYRRLGISDGLDQSGLTLDENIRRLATAPLLFTPGTAWHYSLAVDVLGAVIERATHSALPRVVEQRVTGPLGLPSLKFLASRHDALATPYGDASPQPVRMTDPFALPFFDGRITYSPSRAYDADAYPSGGVGMVSNALDYLRLLETLRMGGGPILRPESVTALTTNAIGTLPTNSGPGFGWGLGVAVLLDPQAAKLPLLAGSWNWAGVYGSNFWVDPAARLSVVVLTNTAVSGMTGAFPLALRHAVYASY